MICKSTRSHLILDARCLIILISSFFFLCRVEKEKAQAVEQQAKVSEQGKSEDFKAHMGAHLKEQRLAAQQVGVTVNSPGSELTFLANFTPTKSTVIICLCGFILSIPYKFYFEDNSVDIPSCGFAKSI